VFVAVRVSAAPLSFPYPESGAFVLKIGTTGTQTVVAGSASSIGGVDGQGASARFRFPADIAIDAFGTLYVADGPSRAIRRITPQGTVTTVVGELTPDAPNSGGEVVTGTLPGQLKYVDSVATGIYPAIYLGTGFASGKLVLKAEPK
jgi:hypothetical protein